MPSPRAAIAIVLALVLASCSFAMTRPRGEYQASELPECSRSRIAPTVDLVAGVAITLVGGMLRLIGTTVCDNDMEGDCDDTKVDLETLPIITVGLIDALIAAPSGYHWASRCRDRHRKHDAWLREHAAPAGSNPGW